MSKLEAKRQELREQADELERLEKTELRRLSTQARRDWKGKCLRVNQVDEEGLIEDGRYALMKIRDIEATCFDIEDDPMYEVTVFALEYRPREKDEDGVEDEEEPEWSMEMHKDQKIPAHFFLFEDVGSLKLFEGARVISESRFREEVKRHLLEVVNTFAKPG